MSSCLQRPALGQKVALGTFYDAHTDTFQNMSLFSGDLPPGLVDSSQRRQHQKTSTALSYIDSYKSRFDLLGITPEIGASLLSGLALAGGSGKCIYEQREMMRSHAGMESFAAFHHSINTAEDILQINNEALREHIATASLMYSECTHVVTGITWGCQTIVTARCARMQDNPKPTVDDTSQETGDEPFTHAMARFKTIVDEMQYMPNLDLSSIHLKGVKLDIAAYSEVFGEGGMVLEDLGEALELIKLLPSLLEQSDTNAGKGEPIAFTLLPIQIVAGCLGLRDTAAAADIRGVDNSPPSDTHAFFNFVLEQFDEVQSVWGKLVHYAGFLAKHKPYVAPGHVEEVDTAIKMVGTAGAELKNMYARILKQGRMYGFDQSAMIRLRDSLVQLISDCTQILDLATDQKTKINFASAAVARGAIYIGYNGVDLDMLLRASAALKHDLYLLSFSQDTMVADEATCNANRMLLEKLLVRDTDALKEAAIIVMDCEAVGKPLETVQIAHYDQQGTRVTQDLHEQQQFEAGHSFARWNPEALESSDKIQKPVQRRMVKIPCPGSCCNSLQLCHWICSQCNSQLEFGFSDDYIYCDCGRAKFNQWSFKCNSGDHEKSARRSQSKKDKKKKHRIDYYLAYSNKVQLLSTLKSLEQTDYVNILILGETGVGKSTFINSLVNYLSFETLDQAKLAEELSWVIPCAFSIQTMDRSQPNGAIKECKIQIGERDDEKDGSSGVSATQQTAVYPVNVGTKTIRLIDTPGIGDTRGLAYDKKNMADILRTLSGYDKLHGILILLKSNNSRLTVTFNFCMQELLTHLHRSASHNMAFGFTNTRISNYSPGDTFGPLTSLLKKHQDIGLALENQNTFCFDSESFRFLAAFKNDIFMENEDDFRRSWDHSREEAVRLVEFFESKTPHQVKSTLSLNGTRQLIAELTKPMADISQIINANIKLCDDQMKELRDTKLSGDKLRRRLQVPKMHLKTVKLDMPRTVCRNKDCVEWRDDGTGSVVRMYKKPCHNPCYLSNVEVDRVNCPELMGCAAFHDYSQGKSNGFCCKAECGHSWQEHLHVYYELEEYTALVTDTEAQRLFQKNESTITVKQTAIEEYERLITEYKEEHAKIQETAVHFGIFLKKHSITPYNDATLEYLDMLIEEEEQKARVTRDRTKLEHLRRDYAAHIELVKTLEDSMTRGDDGANNSDKLDEAGVESLVHDLYGLKHFGGMLHDVKDGLVLAHEATNRERPYKVRNLNSAGCRSRRNKPPPSSSHSSQQSRRAWSDANAGYSHTHGYGDGSFRYGSSYRDYVPVSNERSERPGGPARWVRLKFW